MNFEPLYNSLMIGLMNIQLSFSGEPTFAQVTERCGAVNATKDVIYFGLGSALPFGTGIALIVTVAGGIGLIAFANKREKRDQSMQMIMYGLAGVLFLPALITLVFAVSGSRCW